ncbi:MAG TPA: HAD family acid phosphatase [Gemmatales bacterium]|nr:HAD family acid phosphatase [Gemmatales bacterium]
MFAQSSAEYHACCLQAYNLARDRLEALLAASRPEKPAVILDLDETIFDNTRFQTFLYRESVPYADRLWEIFERDHGDEVDLLPGAKSFLQLCRQHQVKAVLISNRSAQHEATARAICARHGLDLEGLEFMLRTDTGDKTSRRKAVEERYQVLLVLGDNLRDFDETFRVPRADQDRLDDLTVFARVQAERKQKVEDAGARFGRDWIIFPNPIYGEWGKLVEKNPAGKLRPSAMKRPADR